MQVNGKLVAFEDFLFLIQLHCLMRVAFLYDILEVMSALKEISRADFEDSLLLALVPEAELFEECLRLEFVNDTYTNVGLKSIEYSDETYQTSRTHPWPWSDAVS